MIISAKDGVRGQLIDLVSNKRIRKAIWFDIETGDFEAFRLDGNGEIIQPPQKYKGKTKLKFIPDPVVKPAIFQPVAPVKTDTSNGVLRKPQIRQKAKPITVPLFSDFCEHYGCTKVASWMVSDETPLPPLIKDGKAYARAKCVGVHYYCSHHYQPPRQLDAKGEVMKVYEEAGGVRPQ